MTYTRKGNSGKPRVWSGLVEWTVTLLQRERDIFRRLETENERDVFRIVRSYARKADADGALDFPIDRDNLGHRLAIAGKCAAGMRNKLAIFGVILNTTEHVANEAAARLEW